MPGPSPTLALWRGLSIACLTYVGVGEAAAETRYNVSGFGTLGYAVLDHEEAEFRTGRAADGADDRGSFEVDSRLGLQLDLEPNPRWSATFQGLAREGADGEPDAQLE